MSPARPMKRLLLPALLAAALPLAAPETRIERTSPPNPADARPNRDQVPAGYAIDAKFARVVVLRFKFDTDLLAGLEQMVRQERIRNAVILAGIGSVRGYHYHVVSNRAFPSQDLFIRNPADPADLVSMNGYVIDGRVHAHVMFGGRAGAFGGHLEPGTTVFTFAIVTLGVLDDAASLERADDKNYR